MEIETEDANLRQRKRRKGKGRPNRKELESMDKQELIERILRLEANNEQLRALLSRSTDKLDQKQNLRKAQKRFDFSRWQTRHVLLKLYYLGWEYEGMVVQEDTSNTVERYLFDALTKTCLIQTRELCSYHRCGRTDKGVSSFAQVISLSLRSKLPSDRQEDLASELPYCKILNRVLPPSIRCVAWSPVSVDFSARFDCRLRTYKYFFPRGRLDVERMDQAAKFVVGTHDFRNLCKMDVGNGVVNFVRTVGEARVVVRRRCEVDNSGYEICEFVIKSQAFLWHQIRCLMGILMLVGQRKEKAEVIKWLLDVENCPRKPQYNMAHEIPLNLWHCEYENQNWIVDQDELLNTVKVLQKDWTINTVKSVMIENMLLMLEESSMKKNLTFQDECLLLGIQSKVYRPLKDRVTCDSLENKIKQYEKKRKILVKGRESTDFSLNVEH